jgi:hypothetical protein
MIEAPVTKRGNRDKGEGALMDHEPTYTKQCRITGKVTIAGYKSRLCIRNRS